MGLDNYSLTTNELLANIRCVCACVCDFSTICGDTFWHSSPLPPPSFLSFLFNFPHSSLNFSHPVTSHSWQSWACPPAPPSPTRLWRPLYRVSGRHGNQCSAWVYICVCMCVHVCVCFAHRLAVSQVHQPQWLPPAQRGYLQVFER